MKYRIERTEGGEWVALDVWKRGHALLTDPLLNKGTAFTTGERALFELDGMLPNQVTDHSRQVKRAYDHIHLEADTPIGKYVAMAALQERNETLFYQVLAEHVEELIPIVYTPTVGTAAVTFSHLFRRARGMWITPDHRGHIFEILGHARSDDVALIVVTDNERILGLGDQGAGGMVIPVGKLSLYTLAAGIHPAYTLPISLDVGTDNPDLLADELYVGWHHPRLRGPEYDALVDEFVDALRRRWPEALLQWEDFKKANALALLDRYRDVLPSFNDDIQGTAAVVTAGLLAACRATGSKLTEQRVVLAGAGAAGVGIARQLHHTLEAEGITKDDRFRAVTLLDTRGIVVDDRPDIDEYKRSVARPAALGDADLRGAPLETIVDRLRPTVLIGTTGQRGAFTEQTIRAMAAHTERPLVMALSNPTSKTEALPADIAAWSDGRALIATGSPFDPVQYGDRTIPVSQSNNVYVFPGVGLGAIVSRARIVTDAMFTAAAKALASQVSEANLARGMLYPPIAELRAITRHIAGHVARAASDEGVGPSMTDAEIETELDRAIWDLEYPTLRPI